MLRGRRRFLGRVPHREREAMIRRLTELRAEAVRCSDTVAAHAYDDYLLYATTGRDRKKLGMEWAERAETCIARERAMFTALKSEGA